MAHLFVKKSKNVVLIEETKHVKQAHKKIKTHDEIYKQLINFHDENRVPNVLIQGPPSSGKKYILNRFLKYVYGEKEVRSKSVDSYIMRVNCVYGKGIRFIRNELKFFVKKAVPKNTIPFKSVILYNADKLTEDAQSALRRCIEIYNNSTRFFAVVHETTNILDPILSRFCYISVPYPKIRNKQVSFEDIRKSKYGLKTIDRNCRINTILKSLDKDNTKIHIYLDELFEKGVTGEELIEHLRKNYTSQLSEAFMNVRLQQMQSSFYCEKLFMWFVLYYFVLRNSIELENMIFL